MADLAVWIYAVVDGAAAELPVCRGVDPAHPVDLIRHEGLAGVVSSVPRDQFDEPRLHELLEDLDRLEALALAHERVLDEVMRHTAVVPFRLCTIYESAAHVREMLTRERAYLVAALQRLRRMAEWGVKAYAVDGPDAATPSSGTEYLRRRGAGRHARETSEAAAEDVHARLRDVARAAVLSRVQDRGTRSRDAEMVLNAAYLVADADLEGFRALVAELAVRHRPDGLELELTGPWPAYHFCEAR
jgi:hypothetical protein